MRFLQKFNIYFYIIFLIFLFCFIPKVFAYENTDSSWNLTLQDYDTQLRSVDCGDNGTFYNVVNDIINNFDDTYFDLFVGGSIANGNAITFYLSQKNSPNNLLLYSGSVSNNRINMKLYYSSNNFRFPYYTITNETCGTYQSRTDWGYFKTLYETNVNQGGLNYQNYEYNNYSAPVYGNYEQLSNLNNTDSFNTSIWFYYSSKQIKYSYYTNNNYYGKNLCIIDNDTCYSMGDFIPSYYDLYHNGNDNESTFIGYKTSLDTFYTSIPVNNVSNYSLSFNFKVPQSLLGFYQTPQEYINNTNFNYVCSGRINNSNYYTYESFPCSLTSSNSYTDSTITYNFNNFTTNSSLSNYDKIYITIDTKYLDSNINTTIFDLNYNYNLGDFYNTTYKGIIYEKLTNLPLNFRLYLSSNNSLQDSNLYVREFGFLNYHIKYIGFSNTTQQQNLVIGNSILGSLGSDEPIDFISTQVSNNIDTGIMIYQDNSSVLVPNLELFFNNGIVLSFNYNSDSNNFYYVDNTGSIQNNNFVKPTYSTDTSKYDISYYIGQINSFITDLSTDTLEISNLTQTFYNSLPLFFQTFIFVIFILFCIYFIYLLIKR